jgi:hypothetical protein
LPQNTGIIGIPTFKARISSSKAGTALCESCTNTFSKGSENIRMRIKT